MSFRLGGNLGAIGAVNALERNVDHFDKSVRQLASGERISRAADDAAGVAIGATMKGNIRSRGQALRNATDGISLIQVCEGGLATTSNILIRLRELATQTSSDTMGDIERSFVQKEVDELKQQIHVVCHSTEFNGIKLLDASAPLIELQIGTDNKSMHKIVIDTQEMTTNLEKLGLKDLDLSQKSTSHEALDNIDNALVVLNNNRANLGALQNRLQTVINETSGSLVNIKSARSRIVDTDFAETSSAFMQGNIKSQASLAALDQNQQRNYAVLKLLK